MRKQSERITLTLLAVAITVALLPVAGLAFSYTVNTPHKKITTVLSRSVGVGGTFALMTGEQSIQVDILTYDRFGNLIKTAAGTRSTLRSGSWWASIATGTNLAKYQIRFIVKMTNGTTRTYWTPVYTY